jgi:hypothetical protein
VGGEYQRLRLHRGESEGGDLSGSGSLVEVWWLWVDG